MVVPYTQMVDLPSPKNISNTFFELTRPDINLINDQNATYEGVVDEERNVALVQWSQFIEHDLVKTVFQTMSMFNFNSFVCCGLFSLRCDSNKESIFAKKSSQK